jgi:hypothetical protein
MHRRRVTVAAAAVFAVCAAFAAQPTSLQADWGEGVMEAPHPWAPGSERPMSAHDPNQMTLAPPH